MQATLENKCTAKSAYVQCAKKFGCNQMPIKLKKIICVSPPVNGSSFFGSKILLTIIIVFTILFAFITTNVIMA
uniref:Transmembrane protein n=1 Tax=Octopus bimaculoides TaxID=37653 RepID=A0A0L8HQE3_OCTBM